MVDEVRPAAAATLGEVFDLVFEELPSDGDAGLWRQPVHDRLAAAR
jgi:hypothetical protein